MTRINKKRRSMTHAEASAWAMHRFGKRGFAQLVIVKGVRKFTVGSFVGFGKTSTYGISGHSFEYAFRHSGNSVDMNNPAILRVSLAEAIAAKDTGTNATQTALLV